MTEQRKGLSTRDMMEMDSLQLADLRQQRLAEERQSTLSSPSSSRRDNGNNRQGLKAGLGIAGAVLAGVIAMEGISLSPRSTSAEGGPTAAPTALTTEKPSQAPATPEPTPSVSPSASVEPSASPEASDANITSFEVKQLVATEVKAGDWISADVSMSDTKDGPLFPLYDSDYDYLNSDNPVDITRTAMGVDVQADGWVVAPYGDIIVTRGMTADQKALAIANEINLKKRGGQFDDFRVVAWKGLDETENQAGYKFDGTFVGYTTGESPSSVEDMANLTTEQKLEVVVNIFKNYDIDVNSEDGKKLLAILAACLCGCSTPTESPMPSQMPTPEPSSAVCKPKMTDKVVPAGTVWHSNGVDFIIQGDVTIDGRKTYTVGDPNHDRTIDWVTDGKNHTVVFDYESDRQLFNNCSTNAFEQITYNSDKSASTRKIDPKSIVLK